MRPKRLRMKFNYRIQCTKDQLKSIRAFVTRVLREQGVNDLVINELVLAVDEMCANLIIHSHQCNPNEFFDLHMLLEKGKGVTFEFVDEGEGFNITQYQEPTLEQVIREKKKGGIGLILVRRIMDSIQFEQKNNKTIYRLFKKVDLS